MLFTIEKKRIKNLNKDILCIRLNKKQWDIVIEIWKNWNTAIQGINFVENVLQKHIFILMSF